MFLYKAERDLLGWTGDTGAYLRTAMEARVVFGAPPEKCWPYDGNPPSLNSKYDVEPPGFCYAFGASYQTLKYFRLDPIGYTPAKTLDNIKTYAAAGFPSMFGFPVYPEYDTRGPAASSLIRRRRATLAGASRTRASAAATPDRKRSVRYSQASRS